MLYKEEAVVTQSEDCLGKGKGGGGRAYLKATQRNVY